MKVANLIPAMQAIISEGDALEAIDNYRDADLKTTELDMLIKSAIRTAYQGTTTPRDIWGDVIAPKAIQEAVYSIKPGYKIPGIAFPEYRMFTPYAA
jgi:hypothetical protein